MESHSVSAEPAIFLWKQPVKSDSHESRAAKMFREIFESGRPLTYVRSAEEQRVAKVLREAGQKLFDSTPVPVWTWSLTEGCAARTARLKPTLQGPRAALDFIAAHKEPAIFHLKDFHEPLRDFPDVRRRLRDLYEACLDQRKFVVISSPVRFVPEEVERDLVYIELRLPDLVELGDFLRDEAQQIPARGADADLDDGTVHQLARALQGLTLERSAPRGAPRPGHRGIAWASSRCRRCSKRSGCWSTAAASSSLSPDGTDIGQIGGLDVLKNWLPERRKLFQLRDSLSTDIVPKGVLIMGIPGCGKSLCVKAIASHFELPLYRIDMIEIFSGRHGPS